WGGDELVVLMESTEQNQMTQLLDRIRAAMAAKIPIDHRNLTISVSIGTALAPTDGNTPHDLLHVADDRMYKEKLEQRQNAAAADDKKA
ncbi:MAG: diguanylate cyclase, partial [Novosphingobium sp.]